MSDVGGDAFDDDDMLVAEYVLGVLPAGERAAIARRIETDPAFEAAARGWEERLGGLNASFAETPPPAGAFARLEARLFPATGEAPTPWYERLAFWRTAALGAAAVAVLSLGLQVLPLLDSGSAGGPLQVASLSAAEANLTVLTVLDPETNLLHLAASGTGAPAGNDYELWVLPPEEAPISLGIFTAGASENRAIDTTLAGRFDDGISLAVSLEPAGGSPTGAPTGPVLAVGPVAPMVI